MSYPSRSADVATPAERGAGLRPDPAEHVPESERHDIETITVPEDAERYPGFEFEKCRKCGANDRLLDPFERCPEAEDR